MCMCAKPTRNDEDRRWPYRMPEIGEGETVLFEEPGRCSPQVNGTGSTDYHAFNFRFIKRDYGRDQLAVSHGGGVERFDMGYSFRRIPEILAKLDSDCRFLMFVAFMDAHHVQKQATQTQEANKWRTAFVEGRLKKRKMPGRDAVKVWIEASPAVNAVKS